MNDFSHDGDGIDTAIRAKRAAMTPTHTTQAGLRALAEAAHKLADYVGGTYAGDPQTAEKRRAVLAVYSAAVSTPPAPQETAPAAEPVEGAPESIWFKGNGIDRMHTSTVKPERWWEWNEYIRADLASPPPSAAPTVILSSDPTGNEQHMVTLRRNESGKPTVWCDPGITDLVDALNNGTLSTVASCSGHTKRPGWIALADGRTLMVFSNEQDHRKAEAAFPLDIHGERMASAATTDNTALVEFATFMATWLDSFIFSDRDTTVWTTDMWRDAKGRVRALASRPAAPVADTDVAALVEALRTAEAALADIGDADREEGDDLAWCEARAAKALPLIRPVLRAALTDPANNRSVGRDDE